MSFLEGLGIGNYRSFGPNMQYIGPLGMMNIIIGHNNSGKSNILSFLYHRLHQFTRPTNVDLINTKTDRHHKSTSDKFEVALGMHIHGKLREEISAANRDPSEARLVSTALEGILAQEEFPTQNGLKWFHFTGELKKAEAPKLTPKYASDLLAKNDLETRKAWQYMMNVTQVGGNAASPQTRALILENVSPGNLQLRQCIHVPANRSVGPSNTEPNDYSGIGLTKRLFQLQSPTYDDKHEHLRFDAIQNFVRAVLENDSATIRVPHNQSEILVTMDGEILPLTSLGTGIHEVIILGVVASLVTESIVCIEEPELHLHPSLQRKLMAHLATTSNQYFITSHSAHILDTPNAALFHARYVQGSTQISLIQSSQERFEACSDLGYKASDLVQANCVIWVEGPSDRIYLNHWIAKHDGDIHEGVHYSVMFYGGALRKHLSALEPTSEVLAQFVSLLPLNRNPVIVMDSDLSSPDGELSPVVSNLMDEITTNGGLAWVTAGRDIENYVPHSIMTLAAKEAHPQTIEVKSYGPFDEALTFIRTNGEQLKDPDKIRIAHAVAKHDPGLDELDLRSRINALVGFIKSANGLK